MGRAVIAAQARSARQNSLRYYHSGAGDLTERASIMQIIHPADSESNEPVLPRSHRLIRHLALLYGGGVLVALAFLGGALLPSGDLPRFGALARESVRGGLAAMVLGALLLALTALLATLAMTAARFRYSALALEAAGEGAPRRLERGEDPGFAGRMGQAFIVPTGAVCVWIAVRLLWPKFAAVEQAQSADIVAAFVFGFAFVSLVCERVMNAFPAPQLPEAPALRRVLLLATFVLSAAALIELGRGNALGWLKWPEIVVILIPGAVAAELALRALARLFLPARAPQEARAATESLLAGLITGGPRAPANLLRSQFGLDFARSWALSFLSAAMLPALAGTALLCWGLSGLKLIDMEHRGVYERFGAPVAVLGPGLHMLLPWPFGRLRPVEYGTIHAAPIGVDGAREAITQVPIGAEAVVPASFNRLWKTVHADQAHYLVPSPSTAEQSFQSVSTEIYVLYRVGLTNAAALQSVYTVADPQSLIKEEASRLVLRYFNSRTLDQVIGAQRENVAGMLRRQLQSDPDIEGSGIDIVSVLIEEIHPPAGAASAYHAVQAAQINANARISDELGRAKRTAGVAQEEAHELDAAADARATEVVDAAGASAYKFNADHRAYEEGPRPFLLERRLGELVKALSHSHITLVDERLNPEQSPILDLRFGAAAQGGGSGGSGGANSSSATAEALTPPIMPSD
jgi:regulator of protease activity HflC (stomatin/prohibitin superfamily)